MATSNSTTNGVVSAFSSRKNMVGMLLAVLAVVTHLVVGLGPLWPIIAAAAWGIGVTLTPSPQQTALASPTKSYLDAVRESSEQFRELGIYESSKNLLADLQRTIAELENHQDELAAQPILLQTVADISYTHLPTLVSAYAEVPQYARSGGQTELDQSLKMLVDESHNILNALIAQKFKGLEDQRNRLEDAFSGLQLYLAGPKDSSTPSA